MRELVNVIKDFGKVNILVIGDLILDEFIWGDVERISPEAPVPVVWAKKRTFMPGGAANVANNIRSLDANVCLLGVVGRDKNASYLLAELKKRKINVSGIFAEPERYTTVKTRIVASHQQMVRVDWEHSESLPKESNSKILKFLNKNIDKFDAVIIEDYGKGVINKHLLEEAVHIARKRKKVITVDPKEEHFQYYKQVTSITPNRKELENAIKSLKIGDKSNKFKLTSYRLEKEKDIDEAAEQIMEYLKLDSILVTLGEQGMKLFQRNKEKIHIPTVAQEVFDVSGAGDTVIATFSLGLCCQATKLEAAHIANFAAGIVVGKVGTAVVTQDELIKRISLL